MNYIMEFLRECKVFFLATSGNDTPFVRPFGAIMAHSHKLYISTSKNKNVYKQLCKNSNVQIVALKNETREWIRISGQANEVENTQMKNEMLQTCPVLTKHFLTSDHPEFALFEISHICANLNNDYGTKQLVL